ncbi:MAG: flavin reductase family protein [Planctomycetota bacterium]|jgi:flavin reductase (DIM6/NTAB) family NADH-FMN oxidoreductase RutF
MPHSPDPSEDAAPAEALEALARIPTGRFLLVSESGDRRRGCLVRWVQQCGSNPPVVMVALRKGDAISPLIRDSRRFALGMLTDGDGLLPRLFGDADADTAGDPFLGLPLAPTLLDLPVPQRCPVRLECEMIRHLDIDSDCELYVGLVKRGVVDASPKPTTRRRGKATPGRDEPRSPRARRDGDEKASGSRSRARRR